ncbi:MAG TPA: AarF/UbiB family protein [Thermoanaerobaculia bacterium]|nr:AarF/UbiB family protein [Thermoanaerobaculia bacterium]
MPEPASGEGGGVVTSGPWRRRGLTEGEARAAPTSSGGLSATEVEVGYGRAIEIRSAVDAGFRRWRRPPSPPAGAGVLMPLPRPTRLDIAWSAETSPRFQPDEEFQASFLHTFWRLFVWLWSALRFGFGVASDALRGRTGTAARAKRLRLTLERAGPTFVKLGQQLSIRLDLLPYPYALELQRLLDDMVPLDWKVALPALERSLGSPLDKVFASFDPQPIGSASVACVYQAYLRNGDRVAVKLRRPGIGRRLAADMRALSWTLRLLELAVLPPRFTDNFVHELRDMLLAELDFRKEARSIDLFGEAARKAKLRYVRTPKVYCELSRLDLLVTELVTGTWLTELLGAVENDDRRALAVLQSRGIDPCVVARRYLKVNRFGAFEGPLFHADLHPANVLVEPDNHLVLIDFGSVGSFPEQELQVWRRMLDAQAEEDVGGIVRAAVALLEPLPLIDVDEFSKRMEQAFWEDLWATKWKHSEWWERTWANLWIHFLQLAREYNVPMRLNTLRMIRATMLADTIAMRLDHGLDPWAEFRSYEAEASRRARKRVHKRLRRELGAKRWIRTEELIHLVDAAFFRTQRLLNNTSRLYRFSVSVGKAAGSVMIVTKVLLGIAGFAAAVTLGIAGLRKWRPDSFPGSGQPSEILAALADNGWVQAGLLVVFLFTLRRLRYHLDQKVEQRDR